MPLYPVPTEPHLRSLMFLCSVEQRDMYWLPTGRCIVSCTRVGFPIVWGTQHVRWPMWATRIGRARTKARQLGLI